MRRWTTLALAGMLLASLAPCAFATTFDRREVGLLPGDPAPPIRASAWAAGAPIERFEPGRVYVVDLWATWCAPCLATMPLLRGYEERFRDRLTVVALNVWEMAPARVPPLVEARADSMPSHVALDSIPAGREANEGLNVAAFMGVSEWIAIPRTYLIDGTGRVAWIGTPHELEEPLRAVLEGTWDLAAWSSGYLQRLEQDTRYQHLLATVDDAVRDLRWAAALEACEAVLAADTSYRSRIPNQGFVNVATSILGRKNPTKDDLRVARRAVKRALELGASPPWSIHLLAARLARAAGDARAAGRELAEARRLAPSDARGEVPASVEGLTADE